jgi:quercetin dioxygenase-like cupin family protein
MLTLQRNTVESRCASTINDSSASPTGDPRADRSEAGARGRTVDNLRSVTAPDNSETSELSRRGAMKRLGAVGAAAALFAVPTGIAAQDATPVSDAIAITELAPGVTAEVFGAAPSDRAPGQTVYLARFVFQPGAAIFPHSHPGTTLLGVVSGQFGWTLLAGTAHVVHGAAGATPGATEDLTDVNADIVLQPGDAIFYEDDVIHTARGAGDAAAVVHGTLVLTAGQPLLMPMNAMGTPTS